MSSPGAACTGWTAFSPQLPDKAAWLAWLQGSGELADPGVKPSCKFVDPKLRRRMPHLSKMVLHASHELCQACDINPKTVNLVYTARHGECRTLRSILDLLHQKEALSPTAFSNSVHHTPVGYFGITQQNHGIARAISAGAQSFFFGLLETVLLLHKQPDKPVLMVAADEPLPNPFDSFQPLGEHQPQLFHPFAFAIATLWVPGDTSNQLQLAFDADCIGVRDKDPAIAFLKAHLDRAQRLEIPGGSVTWPCHP